MRTVKTASQSKVNGTAGAIAQFLREDKQTIVQAVGKEAISRATKAIALATQFLRYDGLRALLEIEFFTTDNGMNGIRFVVEVTPISIPLPEDKPDPYKESTKTVIYKGKSKAIQHISQS